MEKGKGKGKKFQIKSYKGGRKAPINYLSSDPQDPTTN